jgi:hypothetical protein
MNEEFERGWTDIAGELPFPRTGSDLKEWCRDAFAAGQANIKKSITTNSFGQHHYQRGYKDGQAAEREACAELVESVEDHCYSASAACAYFNQSECVDKSTIFCAIKAIRKRGEVGK